MSLRWSLLGECTRNQTRDTTTTGGCSPTRAAPKPGALNSALESGQVCFVFGGKDGIQMLIPSHRPLLVRAVFLICLNAADWDQVKQPPAKAVSACPVRPLTTTQGAVPHCFIIWVGVRLAIALGARPSEEPPRIPAP